MIMLGSIAIRRSPSIVKAFARLPDIHQGPSKLITLRNFSSHTSARHGNVQALTGYAFAGKPRYAEQTEEDGKAKAIDPKKLPRQGFPIGTPIGKWTDAMLKGGESGEDALSVTKMKDEGDWFLAIADGVGGWSENGVDPALFSQSLIYHASEYAKRFHACPDRLEAEELDPTQQSSPPSSPLDTPPPSPSSSVSAAASKADPGTPLDILQFAYQSTQQEKDVPAGSATACFLTFDSSKGILRSANLGDSGFLVLRPGSSTIVVGKDEEKGAVNEEGDRIGLHVIHHQSKPQTHGFNTPLQLSKLPQNIVLMGRLILNHLMLTRLAVG
ncbi:hypothetical protein L7F22_043861 [Adiantum nelumboides]|nr:hypothetical protein [Adiantum nelumboides]